MSSANITRVIKFYDEKVYFHSKVYNRILWVSTGHALCIITTDCLQIPLPRIQPHRLSHYMTETNRPPRFPLCTGCDTRPTINTCPTTTTSIFNYLVLFFPKRKLVLLIIMLTLLNYNFMNSFINSRYYGFNQ